MKPTFIMLHHTGISYERNPDQFIANNNYHEAQWNFKSSMGLYLGYNYEISKDGRETQARENGEKTAACYQGNMNDGRCIHIALDGNFDIEKPHPPQIYKLRDLLRKLVEEYDIKKKNIVFHRDYSQKSCPGRNIEIEFIRSLAHPEVINEVNYPVVNIKTQIIKSVQNLLALVRKL